MKKYNKSRFKTARKWMIFWTLFIGTGAVAGAPIDHSFLKYKMELGEYGWQVDKISMKNETVRFIKL